MDHQAHHQHPQLIAGGAPPIDGCGCGQSPSALQRAAAGSDDEPVGPQAALPAQNGSAAAHPTPSDAGPQRQIKLVITLQPDGGAGYRAVLAVGAEGCDPLLRSIEVLDLPAALDEVPGLVADAEARWQTQPRNPAATPPKSRRVPPAAAAAEQRPGLAPDPAPTSDTGSPVPPAPPSAKPGARTTSPDQLSLFS